MTHPTQIDERDLAIAPELGEIVPPDPARLVPCTPAELDALISKLEGSPGWHFGKGLTETEEERYTIVLSEFASVDAKAALEHLQRTSPTKPSEADLRSACHAARRKREAEWNAWHRAQGRQLPAPPTRIPPDVEEKLADLHERIAKEDEADTALKPTGPVRTPTEEDFDRNGEFIVHEGDSLKDLTDEGSKA